MRTIAIAAACVALAACAKDPVSVAPTNNPDVSAALLFSVDGCKVYRFEDAGAYRYFATCPNSTVMSSHTVQCGKTRCTHFDDVSTGAQP